MPVNIPVLLADNKNHSTAYPALIHLEFIPALPPPEKQETTVPGNTEILTESFMRRRRQIPLLSLLLKIETKRDAARIACKYEHLSAHQGSTASVHTRLLSGSPGTSQRVPTS